ncbi:hook3 protein [Fusarium flagelliforme]|uniref:Hook3 protein n=1 Tax=Fusarium flagelliforme TaxID=2675880 RepID=A0A395MJ81_9HYPO|nr:hook3 protein [Fusarium flagelliforme]
MPGYSANAQAALIKAVRCLSLETPSPSSSSPLTKGFPQIKRVFEPKRMVESYEDLVDGVTLGLILHQLDPSFDTSALETNSNTSRYNKRNIQNVYKGLFRHIRRSVPELACQAKKFNYHAIAENPDAQGISQVNLGPSDLYRPLLIYQILAVMLAVVLLGPEAHHYIPRITGLDKQTQAEIMQIIQSIQQDINDSHGDEDVDEAVDAVMEARDIDLIVEEQNALLRARLESANIKLSDYITRLDHLQTSYEELRSDKEKNDRELEVLRKATADGVNHTEIIKNLEIEVQDQMEIITQKEEMIRSHERAKSQLEAEVTKLTEKCKEAEELRDQVSEWKHKAEDFEKKANTADRYKQKLETQQHLVKEVQNLQYEKTELQDQIRILLEDQDRGARTRKAEDELTKMITQSEQHLWDERSQKNQLMKDIAALEDEVIRLRARQNHDENFIKDLQEQLESGAGSQSAAPGALDMASSLEDELNDAANEDTQPGQVNLPLELSRLKAENDLLRSTVGSGDTAPLRRELDEEKRQRAHVQKSHNDIFEKHAVLHEQMEALINNMTGEGTKAFINIKQTLMQCEFELEQSRKREKDLSAQVADQGRELLAAKAQLSALDKEGADALKEIKSSDVVIISSLKSELDHAREQLSYCISERDAQQTQLVEALLAKDKLRKEVEEGRELQDITGGGEGDASDGSKKGELIEKLRNRLREIREVSVFYRTIMFGDEDDQVVVPVDKLSVGDEDVQQLFADLAGENTNAATDSPLHPKEIAFPPSAHLPRRPLKQGESPAAHDGEAVAAQKAASDEIIRNLERENSLIASAWYDLTSRLQSNHVVLQRRHEAPRSWLNKQRQMVNGQLRFRDSLYLY